MKIPSLDYLASKTAQNMLEQALKDNSAKDIETLVTKALGVLQAQGVYALYLYLFSQASDKNPAVWTLFYLWNALRDNEIPVPLPDYLRNKINPLNNPEAIFCDPPALARSLREKYKEKPDILKAKENLKNCKEILDKEKDFWRTYILKSNKSPSGESPAQKNVQTPSFEYTKEGSMWKFKQLRQIKNWLNSFKPARSIILEQIRELTAHLEILLLVRELYEQTLIYARYHAKAAGKQGGSS